MRRLTRILGIAAAAAPVFASALPAQTIAITGGRVFPVSGAPIEDGTVIIQDGRIAAVGANVPVPAGAQRIDASGKWVTPGLINPATQLGLIEVGQVGETRDASARGRGDAINASFTPWLGLNPASVLLAPAREMGVTSVVVLPSGGLISGQAALIDLLSDTSVSAMLRRAPIAMVAQTSNPGAAQTSAQGELLIKLRELLDDTRAYAQRRADYERGATRDLIARRIDLEAMIPVVRGALPIIVNADSRVDIESALDLAREYELRLIIGGGTDAWQVADRLATARVPVMTGAINNIPGFSSLGIRQDNAALLRRAGVDVLLVGTGSDPLTFNVRNITQEAGNAVSYGMEWNEALRAITLAPAEVFGVADRVGSLQPGRDANVVVWSGDPFEFATRAEQVFIRGVAQPLGESRQDQLTERYRRLPPDYRGTP
ncbi:MAG TPA: amidohydrolase family protein [Gemmatimonadaceae bacterium]|nr:amidohydrolase family protein [Gemmatimonadaceae bacterium]